MLASLAAIAGLAASGCIYLASPHQRWCARPLSGRWCYAAACALLLTSLLLFLRVQGGGTAVFSWLSVQMLALSTWPFLGLLARDKSTR